MIEKIETDLTASMKEGDKLRTSVLRMLKSSLHNAKISSGNELSDEQVQKIIRKEIKQREESALAYEKADRKEAAISEKKEAEILLEYLPPAPSDEEIDNLVDRALKETGAISRQEMGKVMGWLKSNAPDVDSSLLASRASQKLG